MVQIETKSDIEPAVNEFNDVLSEPVGRVAKFYTLYYISEEMGNMGLGFDMKQETEKQSDSFYNYSVYSCITELKNLIDQLRVGSLRLGEITDFAGNTDTFMEGQYSQKEKEAMLAIFENIKMEIEDGAPDGTEDLVKDLMLRNPITSSHDTRVIDIVASMEIAEDDYSALTEPQRFLKGSSFIFGNDWGVIYGEEEDGFIEGQGDEENIGWVGAYGGLGWERVAKTAMMNESMGGVAFVDLMWSVEHNNGNFTDKIPNTRPSDVQAFVDQLQWEAMQKGIENKITIEQTVGDSIWTEFRGDVLNTALDFAKDGNIRPLFQIAKRNNRVLSNPQLRDSMFPMKKMFIEDDRILRLLEE